MLLCPLSSCESPSVLEKMPVELINSIHYRMGWSRRFAKTRTIRENVTSKLSEWRFEDGQVEFAEALAFANDLHLNDLPVIDLESESPRQPST